MTITGLGWAVQQSAADSSDGDTHTAVATTDPTKTARPHRKPTPSYDAPRRITIPALDVTAPVLPIDAPHGTLVPPSDPQRVGWWSAGARPGAARGTALLTGHTVHTGGGALDNLADLTPGDRIVVADTGHRIHYAVQRVRTLGKAALARRAEQLFDQGVAGRLVVVTCADWDGTGYRSNVVVTAVPSGTRSR